MIVHIEENEDGSLSFVEEKYSFLFGMNISKKIYINTIKQNIDWLIQNEKECIVFKK